MHAMFRACAQAQGDAHNRERSAASFISSQETDLSRFSASLVCNVKETGITLSCATHFCARPSTSYACAILSPQP